MKDYDPFNEKGKSLKMINKQHLLNKLKNPIKVATFDAKK